jgi:hypothetical protein
LLTTFENQRSTNFRFLENSKFKKLLAIPIILKMQKIGGLNQCWSIIEF